MPARTNEFQQLVMHIQETLAPTGATVSESSMVESDCLTTPREVDILVDAPLGLYRVKVAIETADDSRPFGIEDFDSYVAKYRGECRLLVDKFLIVTRRGYTQSVREKAAKLDVELLTLEEAKRKDWSDVRPQMLHFSLAPHICRVRFEPPIEAVNDMHLWMNARMICPHGRDYGTPMERANSQLRALATQRADFLKDAIKQVRANGGVGHLHSDDCFAGWKVLYQGKEHVIQKMGIDVHIADGEAPIKCTDYELSDSQGRRRRFRQMESTVAGQKFKWLLTDEQPQPRMVMKIDRAGLDGAHPNPPHRVGRNDPCPCGSGKKYKKCCLKNR